MGLLPEIPVRALWRLPIKIPTELLWGSSKTPRKLLPRKIYRECSRVPSAVAPRLWKGQPPHSHLLLLVLFCQSCVSQTMLLHQMALRPRPQMHRVDKTICETCFCQDVCETAGAGHWTFPFFVSEFWGLNVLERGSSHDQTLSPQLVQGSQELGLTRLTCSNAVSDHKPRDHWSVGVLG